MTFSPNIGDTLVLADGSTYAFQEHPTARGMVHAQDGRRAMVYRLRRADSTPRQPWLTALKVYKPQFQQAPSTTMLSYFDQLSSLPGMHACKQRVLDRSTAPATVSANPELLYAVQMPWIDGMTWQEIVMQNTICDVMFARVMASNLLNTLCALEATGTAHCDISGANVMIDLRNAAVSLVDFDDMYHPLRPRPTVLAAGSAGYAHRTADAGIWTPAGDRFAGAVILSEMLTMSSMALRANLQTGIESVFAPHEMQQRCTTYKIMHAHLAESWGARIASLFEAAWFSQSFDECPTFHEWQKALEPATESAGKFPTQDDLLLDARKLIEAGQLEKGIQILRNLHTTHPSLVTDELYQALIKLDDYYTKIGDKNAAMNVRRERSGLRSGMSSQSSYGQSSTPSSSTDSTDSINRTTSTPQQITAAPIRINVPDVTGATMQTLIRDYRKEMTMRLAVAAGAIGLLAIFVTIFGQSQIAVLYAQFRTLGLSVMNGTANALLGILVGLLFTILFQRLRANSLLFIPGMTLTMGVAGLFGGQFLTMPLREQVILINSLANAVAVGVVFMAIVRPSRIWRWGSIVSGTTLIAWYIGFSLFAVPYEGLAWAVILISLGVVVASALRHYKDVEI